MVRPRIPRRALLRFLVLVGVMVGAIVLLRFSSLGQHLEPQRLLGELRSLREVWWSPLALIGLYLVVAPFGLPISPLLIAGGVVFGGLFGSVLSFVGTLLGALGAFLMARLLGQELIHHLFGQRLRRIEARIARRGFWPLVQLRLLPIPFALINVGAAMTSVSIGTFTTSSAVGLLPTTVIYTYFWAALASSVAGDREGIILRVVIALGLMFTLTLLPGFLRGRLRRQRLAALRSQRRGRNNGS